MAQFTIAAKVRNETGKKAAKAIRAAGNIPAVVYDEAGKATSITVNSVEFNKVWRNITKTTLVTLDVDGKSCDAFISDVEYDISMPISSPCRTRRKLSAHTNSSTRELLPAFSRADSWSGTFLRFASARSRRTFPCASLSMSLKSTSAMSSL